MLSSRKHRNRLDSINTGQKVKLTMPSSEIADKISTNMQSICSSPR